MNPQNWLEEIKPYREWFEIDYSMPSLEWIGPDTREITKEDAQLGAFAKWQIIREESVLGSDLLRGVSADTCTLCRVSNLKDQDSGCWICPIGLFDPKGKYTQCHDTPYYEYIEADTWEEGEQAAANEIEFLFKVFFPGLSEKEIADLVALGKPKRE